MAADSKIEWTEATWNPVRGCTRVSPGCGGPGKHGGCYAEKIAARFSDPGQPFHGFAERTRAGGRWTGNVDLVEDMVTVPLHWKKPRRVFVNSMSDLFHEALSDAAIDRVFAIMALCPQHTFQVLTKRPARMWEYFARPDRIHQINGAIHSALGSPRGSKIEHGGNWRAALPLANVWLGVSAERQQEADARIPRLLQTPAAVHFVSLEPLLGPILLKPEWLHPLLQRGQDSRLHVIEAGLDWVIVGGESGPNARPMHPDWARSLRDQCATARVPFFFKQWGEWAPATLIDAVRRGKRSRAIDIDGKVPPGDPMTDDGCAAIIKGAASGSYTFVAAVGKKRAGRLLDGDEHSAFPKVCA